MAETFPAFDRQQVAGLILAGGQGSRMQGHDKGLVPLAGEPLVAHVARRLAPQVGPLILSANRNADIYARYGRVVADDTDALGAWQGPLAGLAAGLAAAAPCEWLVVAPCDTPFLPADLAQRLIAAARAAGAPLAYAMAGGQRHPACMALRTSMLPALRDYLAAGERKVGLWQSRVGGVGAPFDDVPGAPGAFMNLNTPEELAAAERYASQ
ncbi:molybdenum cofactor guanylyltransferase MobA [Achromobacter xylosoxidans]|uniref:molybdenum cofactor guanylyltransferase MobA n=1 Tax=Alcaligenes xylosoxydans xylosoxydans TaxID=85698 RepID=UPI0022B866EF|nr:molybdenum cofactor guanylyltransferase MobA [Achromobacter xylosoxidans]MCZ8393869.1 molybdenum cofactor guanylyltransferase [Achromobacter xylosoxidans]